MSIEWPTEERIDNIGQNGNNGEHYEEVSMTELLRDKEEGDVVGSRVEYKDGLYDLITARVDELQGLDMRSKDRVYEIISDLVEATQCYYNQYLVTKSEVSSMARHVALQKVCKERAEQLGGYFNGVCK
jgi:hypothetical protein